MATTRIMPLHVGKGRTESRAIRDVYKRQGTCSARLSCRQNKACPRCVSCRGTGTPVSYTHLSFHSDFLSALKSICILQPTRFWR